MLLYRGDDQTLVESPQRSLAPEWTVYFDRPSGALLSDQPAHPGWEGAENPAGRSYSLVAYVDCALPAVRGVVGDLPCLGCLLHGEGTLSRICRQCCERDVDQLRHIHCVSNVCRATHVDGQFVGLALVGLDLSPRPGVQRLPQFAYL